MSATIPNPFVELSIIIPAFNEAATLPQVLAEVDRAAPLAQVIVVDDGSCDAGAAIAETWTLDAPERRVLIRHDRNRGKGRAIRSAIEHVQGALVLIQDADLECSPSDYPALLEPFRESRELVVFGSRYLKPSPTAGWSLNRVGVRMLDLMIQSLFGRRIIDHACCFKVFPIEILRRLDLECERFELCAEVAAKLCLTGVPIVQVPVSYAPRDRKAGKKLRPADGIAAAKMIWRVRRRGNKGRSTR